MTMSKAWWGEKSHWEGYAGDSFCPGEWNSDATGYLGTSTGFTSLHSLTSLPHP